MRAGSHDLDPQPALQHRTRKLKDDHACTPREPSPPAVYRAPAAPGILPEFGRLIA